MLGNSQLHTMQIQAYKHAPTGRIFETEESYEKYLTSYKKEQLAIKKKKEKEKKFHDMINAPRLTATSLEDFRLKVFELLKKANKKFGVQLLSFDFTDIRYQMKLSNSHNCPIGSEYTQNWGGADGKPKGYPGWKAQLKGRTIHNHCAKRGTYLTHRMGVTSPRRCQEVSIPGLNSGSGGGVESFSYELSLFLYDFPLIHKQYKDSLNESGKLILDNIQQAEDAQKSYLVRKESYINQNEEIQSTKGTFDNNALQILKLQEANKLLQNFLTIRKQELADDYTLNVEPWDFEKVNDLKMKQIYIQNTINPE